jgi:hypothetical protein
MRTADDDDYSEGYDDAPAHAMQAAESYSNNTVMPPCRSGGVEKREEKRIRLQFWVEKEQR